MSSGIFDLTYADGTSPDDKVALWIAASAATSRMVAGLAMETNVCSFSTEIPLPSAHHLDFRLVTSPFSAVLIRYLHTPGRT